MIRKITTLIIALTLALTPVNAIAIGEEVITPENWGPLSGDHIVLDVDINTGYLIHTNGKKLEFPIITGQQRYVRYIGLSYYAGTPKKQWVVEEMDTQPDRYTYGKRGRFFRLSSDGGKTHYGIHGHAAEEIMFARENRYQSMGCPILPDNILDIVEETFKVNEGRIEVETI